jgi:hypothetical protein
VFVEKRVRHCPLKENMIGRVLLRKRKRMLDEENEDINSFYSDNEGERDWDFCVWKEKLEDEVN